LLELLEGSARMSSGHSKKFAKKFLAKAADGNSRTFGKSKGKKTIPWFSAKAPSTQLACRLRPLSLCTCVEKCHNRTP